MWASFALLIALFPVLDIAQSIVALQAELRRLGCSTTHCTTPLRCENGLKTRDVTTDFGLISCVPTSPFDQLSEVTLDGFRVALAGAGANLTLPGGATLQNVTVRNQPFLQSIDMSGLTNVDNAIIADNAVLVSLVVAGGCVRVLSNPRLAIVVFATPMLTRFVEFLGNPLLATLDVSTLGSQFNELKLIALNALTSITGLRGRSMLKVHISDNPALTAADDLDFEVSAFLNVSNNPKLNGVCRLRTAPKTPIPEGCEFTGQPCLVGADRCLSGGVCPDKKSSNLNCKAPVSTSNICAAPPPVVCPPYSLRFSTIGDTSLARSKDIAWCVTIGAPARRHSIRVRAQRHIDQW
jgi:hypothetical protein